MSTTQADHLGLPAITPMEDYNVKSCLVCPEAFWGQGLNGRVRRCVQCQVHEFERQWQLQRVLWTTEVYKKWLEKISGSTVNIQNKEILTLELQSRLFWLHERQEFIRLESERIVKEVEAGHDSMCVCRGGISWEQMEHGPMDMMELD
jgi:hypothetical protein